MSAKLKHYNYSVLTIEGQSYEVGSLRVPAYQSISGEFDRFVKKVAVSSSEDIWDVSNSNLSDFDFLWIAADFDCSLELIVDDNGSVGEVAFTVDLVGTGRAGEFGMPFILASDASRANNTAGFAGTIDVIERISAKNLSSSNIVTLQMMVAS